MFRCLFVSFYPVNCKTAEPYEPEFVMATYLSPGPGKVYEPSKMNHFKQQQKFCEHLLTIKKRLLDQHLNLREGVAKRPSSLYHKWLVFFCIMFILKYFFKNLRISNFEQKYFPELFNLSTPAQCTVHSDTEVAHCTVIQRLHTAQCTVHSDTEVAQCTVHSDPEVASSHAEIRILPISYWKIS